MPIAPSPEFPPMYDVIVDQPFVADATLRNLALGVQALIVRALWAAGLEASPATQQDPRRPGHLKWHESPRHPADVVAPLYARGFATRHLLQLGLACNDDGLFIQARMFADFDETKAGRGRKTKREAGAVPEFVLEPGACDLIDGLAELLEFVIDEAALDLETDLRELATDPYELWGTQDPGLLVAELCSTGAGLRVLMPNFDEADDDPFDDGLEDLEDLEDGTSGSRAHDRPLHLLN